jgi:undecaprenyl diphosphate synthase
MSIPYHIAIIMDGNGRWAKRRGLPRSAGHRKGINRVKEIVREAKRLGVKVLTLFAFSTENWNRPKKEISFLFHYLDIFLNKYKEELIREDIKLSVIGRRDRIKRETIRHIEVVEKLTCNNKSFIFNIALDYGGRWDIVEAAKRVAIDYSEGKISEEDINEASFHRYLALGNISNPDLLIRTAGEQRVSNFLLWNLAYTEFYFPEVTWPDFDKEELRKAIEVYSQRERRFGSVCLKE